MKVFCAPFYTYLFVSVCHHGHCFLEIFDGLHTKCNVVGRPRTLSGWGGDGGVRWRQWDGPVGGVGWVGGGLSNGGDGLCRRGQVCTGRLGHHIQGMLQGVAKQRKQIKTLSPLPTTTCTCMWCRECSQKQENHKSIIYRDMQMHIHQTAFVQLILKLVKFGFSYRFSILRPLLLYTLYLFSWLLCEFVGGLIPWNILVAVSESKLEPTPELYWLALDPGEYIARDDGLLVTAGCGLERDVSWAILSLILLDGVLSNSLSEWLVSVLFQESFNGVSLWAGSELAR